jgi:hypothetical protein
MMKYFSVIIFMLLIHPFVSGQSNTYIDDSTGVKFVFNVEKSMFPSSWYKGKINAKVEALDTTEIERSVKVLKLAMSKYPPGLISKNLKKIYVLKNLEFYGVGYGGTYSDDIIYLANSGKQDGYTDDFIERGFHEEFSSVLLQNYSGYFDKVQWNEINGPEFKYGCVNGYEAIESGNASEKFEEKYNEMGFLDQYATSTMENDLNAYAKNIFCPRENFWDLVQKYRKLDAKLRIVIDFYAKIDPMFNFNYFLNLLLK